MFVKGVCKYIFIFCLFENEKKKKKIVKDNNRSWYNLMCYKNDFLNFICVFFVWFGFYLNFYKWVLNFSECEFIWFYVYLIIFVCYKYVNFSVVICCECFFWLLFVIRKFLWWYIFCVLVFCVMNVCVFMEWMKFYFFVLEVWIL